MELCLLPWHAVPHLFKSYYPTKSYHINKVYSNSSSFWAFLSLTLMTIALVGKQGFSSSVVLIPGLEHSLLGGTGLSLKDVQLHLWLLSTRCQ